MLTLESQEFRALVVRAAELRGGGDFAGAIALVESKLGELESDCMENAYQQCFYAAHEAATAYAKKLAKLDPNLPSIQAYLGGGGPGT